MTAPNEKLRFSLRTMLIAFSGFGVYIGVMGRLFMETPQVFYSIWALSTTLVPFIIAIGLLLGLSRDHKSRRMIRLVAILLALAPIVGLIGVPAFQFLRRTVGPAPTVALAGPQDYPTIATPLLIANYLPAKVSEPWVWNELERRVSAGNLSPEDTHAAIQVLVKHLQSQVKTNGLRSVHLSWQRQFLKLVQQNNLVGEQQLIPLHDVFVKEPELELDRVRENSKRMGFELEYGEELSHSSNLPFQLVWSIKAIKIDANPPKTDRSMYQSTERRRGVFTGPFPSGEHEIEFVIEAAYVPKEKMIGLDSAKLRPADWPITVKRWEEKVKRKFVVHTADEQIIKLNNDPKLNPTSAINAQLTVQNDGEQKKIIIEVDIKEPPLSCSFACKAIVNDEEIQLGRCYYICRKNGSTSSDGTRTGKVDSLPDEAFYGTVVLTPNPANVTKYSDLKEIWGKEIILPGIELRRFDLEAGQ